MTDRPTYRCVRDAARRVLAWMTLIGVMLPAAALAGVQLELDRTRVVAGETVTLTFRTDDARQSLDTDFGALETDFHILDRRSETQLSIVNGQQTAVVRLLLTVEPRRTGTIRIPSIRFGAAQTQAAVLEVEPAPELAPGELPPVFIEVELNPGEGPWYVHAQFGLVVRVFYQQNLTEAAISQPEPAPASVRLLQETPYQAERAGERYRVLERVYAIFPERSGELQIPPLELTGRLVERRSSGVWQPQVRGRRIRAASEALTLHIEPRPAAFSGAEWQPARELVLSQQVSSGEELRVGEPVTRTVLIDAVGLEENMVAEPAWPALPDARIYPDQPQGITRDDGRWVLGHKEFRYAVVPEREGELVLPELTLDWWDTVNHVQRTATLPEHRLFVQPSALVPPTAPVATPAASTPAPHADSEAPRAGAKPWRALTLLFAVLWLATLAFAWRRGRGGDAARDAAGRRDERSREEAALLGELKRASMAGDSAGARGALHAWLSAHAPGLGDSVLEFAAATGEPDLRDSIYDMDAAGFRRDRQSAWDGKAFWRRFEVWRKDAIGRNGPAVAATDLYARENRVG